MPLQFELAREAPDDIEALAVPAFGDEERTTDDGLDWLYLGGRGFAGKVGDVQVLPDEGGKLRLVVGLGPRADVDAHVLRRAGAALARAASRQQVVATTLLSAVPDGVDRGRAAQAIVEGAALATYRFDRYKSDPNPPKLERLVLVGTGGKKVQEGIDRAARIAEAVAFARDLVNEPGGTLTPRVLAEAAVEVAERESLGCSILDEDDMVEQGLGGILGVNRGSVEPPRLIQLSYEPDKPRATVALVGKGITFDSGGLSIKPADGMITMKTDMSGGATVLAVMSVISQIAPRVRVLGYVPATDNMTGGDATRPGDVLKIRNGKTVEVLNTDAEGRIVLADALSLAAEEAPDAILDLATLTGACKVALGDHIAGLMGNHDGLLEQVEAASERSGERVWRLPLPRDYRKQIDSEIADIKNTGGRSGGALTAGLFLEEFVDGIPWAHLDIAGPARSEDDREELVKGGTGYGVRLVLELLADFKKPAKPKAAKPKP